MRRSWLLLAVVALSVCFAAGLVMSRHGPEVTASPDAVPIVGAEGAGEGKVDRPALPWRDPQVGSVDVPPSLGDVDLSSMVLDGERYVVDLPDGRRAVLTLVPEIQQRMTEFFARYEVPRAGFVALEPTTGRVLALVGHEIAEEPLGDPANKAYAPSASLFKIITAAALIEDHGMKLSDVTCVPAVTSPLTDDLISRGASAEDTRCLDLGEAFGESNNAVFARLAYAKLGPQELRTWSARFGYDEWLPFSVGIEPSRTEIPDDQVGMARTAAGFWNTYLSPMHAAMIAGAIGNGGIMMRPNMVESLSSPDGELEYVFSAVPFKQVMAPETARQVADLMVRTTTIGTAKKTMSSASLPELPEGFTPVGKTGTLASNRPYVLYNWFAGFAPIEKPEVAMAVLVCNPLKWRIKAGHGAAEGLRAYLAVRQARAARAAAPDGLEALPSDADPDPSDDPAPAVVEPPSPAAEGPAPQDVSPPLAVPKEREAL